MALVQIENVNVAAAQPDYFRGFAIDCPAANATSDVYDIEISGWAIGASQPVVAIEIHIAGSRLRRVPLDQLRPDLALAHPGVAGRGKRGVPHLGQYHRLAPRHTTPSSRRVRR